MSLPYNFQWHRLHRFEHDAIDTLTLALVSHRGIELGGLHVLMSEHVLDDVDARTCINLQGAVWLLFVNKTRI